jgi:hypothetical protein
MRWWGGKCLLFLLHLLLTVKQWRLKEMSNPVFAIVELSGHIIDSLTLTKVIDRIQAHGCQYQINDILIGEKKNDLSYAQLSLWASDQSTLEMVVSELRAYGAVPVENTSTRVAPSPADGVVPEESYVRLNPPIEVLYQDQWVPVQRQGFNLVIVIDPDARTARLQKVGDVKKGDLIVLGKTGVKVLPTLGETSDAQLVTG